jgi:hypothetical protein
MSVGWFKLFKRRGKSNATTSPNDYLKVTKEEKRFYNDPRISERKKGEWFLAKLRLRLNNDPNGIVQLSLKLRQTRQATGVDDPTIIDALQSKTSNIVQDTKTAYDTLRKELMSNSNIEDAWTSPRNSNTGN